MEKASLSTALKVNHYPDFIIYTKRGNIVVIQTKGDNRDNEDSRDKNRWGKTRAEKVVRIISTSLYFKAKKWKTPKWLKV